jgi:hypothetical protein
MTISSVNGMGYTRKCELPPPAPTPTNELHDSTLIELDSAPEAALTAEETLIADQAVILINERLAKADRYTEKNARLEVVKNALGTALAGTGLACAATVTALTAGAGIPLLVGSAVTLALSAADLGCAVKNLQRAKNGEEPLKADADSVANLTMYLMKKVGISQEKIDKLANIIAAVIRAITGVGTAAATFGTSLVAGFTSVDKLVAEVSKLVKGVGPGLTDPVGGAAKGAKAIASSEKKTEKQEAYDIARAKLDESAADVARLKIVGDVFNQLDSFVIRL